MSVTNAKNSFHLIIVFCWQRFVRSFLLLLLTNHSLDLIECLEHTSRLSTEMLRCQRDLKSVLFLSRCLKLEPWERLYFTILCSFFFLLLLLFLSLFLDLHTIWLPGLVMYCLWMYCLWMYRLKSLLLSYPWLPSEGKKRERQTASLSIFFSSLLLLFSSPPFSSSLFW